MDEKKTLAAFIGALVGVSAARAVDLALVGAGLATATSAVGFAGYMMLTNDHQPHVNGMEYLAIFAQPSHHLTHGPDSPDPAKVDERPVGSLPPREVKDNVAGYSLVGAQPNIAWLREGNRIFSVHPGEEVPRLGRIAGIEKRDGRWTLLDKNGEPLLVSSVVELSANVGARFDKRLIFGN